MQEEWWRTVLTDTGEDSKLVHRRKRPKVDTTFSSLFFRRVRATSMPQRRVENTRVHFWTFLPVSVNNKLSQTSDSYKWLWLKIFYLFFRKKPITLIKTFITAIGGVHSIATTLTDLYSPNFRTNLMKWLSSIPYFSRPFELQMQRIPNLLKHLIDDLIDPQCYQQCFIDREPNCVKQRQHKIACNTEFATTNEYCKTTCASQSLQNIIIRMCHFDI